MKFHNGMTVQQAVEGAISIMTKFGAKPSGPTPDCKCFPCEVRRAILGLVAFKGVEETVRLLGGAAALSPTMDINAFQKALIEATKGLMLDIAASDPEASASEIIMAEAYWAMR